MKINVFGKGKVPGLNGLAPLYNKDADTNLIKRILAYRVFRVFDAETNLQITTKNIEEYVNVELEENQPIVPKFNNDVDVKIDNTAAVAPAEVEAEEKVEVVPDPVVHDEEPYLIGVDMASVLEIESDEPTVEDVVDVVEEIVEPTVEEETETVENAEDETTEEAPRRRNKKKRH